MKKKLTHLNNSGEMTMVDISDKKITNRIAKSKGVIYMKRTTLNLIRQNLIKKGDVLAAARLAGIQAAKHTPNLIPLSHPIRLSLIQCAFILVDTPVSIEIESTVKCSDRTGAEIEALMAVQIAALTIYDMCKSVDRTMRIDNVRLTYKSGGKSGTFTSSRPRLEVK